MKILLHSLIWYFISSHSYAKVLSYQPVQQGRQGFVYLDTIKTSPKSLRIFTNVYLPAQLFFSDRFRSGEASVELWQGNGKAWVGEMGYAQRIRNNGNYNLQGTYLRIGREIGFWEKQPARRALGAWQMGLRLCGSIADYKINTNVPILNPYWGTNTFETQQKGVFSLWAESHISLRARIGKRFMMGPMLKAKFLLISPKSIFGNHPPEIVGFGVRRALQGEAGYWVGVLLEK